MFPRGSAGLNPSSCDIYDHFDFLKGNFPLLCTNCLVSYEIFFENFETHNNNSKFIL